MSCPHHGSFCYNLYHTRPTEASGCPHHGSLCRMLNHTGATPLAKQNKKLVEDLAKLEQKFNALEINQLDFKLKVLNDSKFAVLRQAEIASKIQEAWQTDLRNAMNNMYHMYWSSPIQMYPDEIPPMRSEPKESLVDISAWMDHMEQEGAIIVHSE